MKNQGRNIFRREFLKGLGALPFLGYFAFNVRENIARDARVKHKDYLLKIRMKMEDGSSGH